LVGAAGDLTNRVYDAPAYGEGTVFIWGGRVSDYATAFETTGAALKLAM
jgi:hypothetical protein